GPREDALASDSVIVPAMATRSSVATTKPSRATAASGFHGGKGQDSETGFGPLVTATGRKAGVVQTGAGFNPRNRASAETGSSSTGSSGSQAAMTSSTSSATPLA